MENINLIRKIAWSFHNTTGYDWDDLFQEAALAYCIALKRYNPSRGKLTTYMWRTISNHLQLFITYQNKWNDKTISIEDALISKPTTNPSFLDSLGREARDIVDVILSSPAEFDALDPKKALKTVMNKLRGKRWSAKKIEQGVKELKVVLN